MVVLVTDHYSVASFWCIHDLSQVCRNHWCTISFFWTPTLFPLFYYINHTVIGNLVHRYLHGYLFVTSERMIRNEIHGSIWVEITGSGLCDRSLLQTSLQTQQLFIFSLQIQFAPLDVTLQGPRRPLFCLRGVSGCTFTNFFLLILRTQWEPKRQWEVKIIYNLSWFALA